MNETFDRCYERVDYSPYTRWEVVEHIESFGLEALDPYLPEPITCDDTVVYAIVPVSDRRKDILTDHMLGRVREARHSTGFSWRRPMLHSGPAFRIEKVLPMWDAYFDYFYDLLRNGEMRALVSERDDLSSLEFARLHDPNRHVLNALFEWSKVIWAPINPKANLFAYTNNYVLDRGYFLAERATALGLEVLADYETDMSIPRGFYVALRDPDPYYHIYFDAEKYNAAGIVYLFRIDRVLRSFDDVLEMFLDAVNRDWDFYIGLLRHDETIIDAPDNVGFNFNSITYTFKQYFPNFKMMFDHVAHYSSVPVVPARSYIRASVDIPQPDGSIVNMKFGDYSL